MNRTGITPHRKVAITDSTLVLGAGGFIGTRLLALLQGSGRHVVALGHALQDHRTESLITLRGSVEDIVLLRELLPSCNSVVYLASATTPGASAREPGLEVTGNLLPLARFLEVALDFPGRKLIYVSSAGAVYGDCSTGVVEDAPLRPRSFYGAGKAAAEALLHALAVNSDWSVVIMRPTNVYGPSQLPSKGFAIVPTIFRRLQEGSGFEVWGDGEVVRDYLHVDDLVRLISLVLKSQRRDRFGAYNVASGCAVSVRDLIALCESVSGLSLNVMYKPARKVDVPAVVPDTSAVTSAFGWGAEVALRTGLEQTWKWLSEQWKVG